MFYCLGPDCSGQYDHIKICPYLKKSILHFINIQKKNWDLIYESYTNYVIQNDSTFRKYWNTMARKFKKKINNILQDLVLPMYSFWGDLQFVYTYLLSSWSSYYWRGKSCYWNVMIKNNKKRWYKELFEGAGNSNQGNLSF